MSEELVSPQLPAVGLVAALSKEDRDLLSSYGEFHLAAADDQLIGQGQAHGKLFFVVSGLLHAVRHEDDREELLGVIRQGEWLGEVDLFDEGTAMCDVVVIEAAQYWAITRADFKEFLKNYPEAGLQVVTGVAVTLSKRLRGVTRQLMDEAEMTEVRAALLSGEG